MGLAKEEARRPIDSLPEQAHWDDIMYEFYVKKKLAAALEAVEQRKVVRHDVARKRLLSQ